MMLTGGVKALGIFGPIKPRRPSKTRSGTKGDLYRLSAASVVGLEPRGCDDFLHGRKAGVITRNVDVLQMLHKVRHHPTSQPQHAPWLSTPLRGLSRRDGSLLSKPILLVYTVQVLQHSKLSYRPNL